MRIAGFWLYVDWLATFEGYVEHWRGAHSVRTRLLCFSANLGETGASSSPEAFLQVNFQELENPSSELSLVTVGMAETCIYEFIVFVDQIAGWI